MAKFRTPFGRKFVRIIWQQNRTRSDANSHAVEPKIVRQSGAVGPINCTAVGWLENNKMTLVLHSMLTDQAINVIY
jgi:hypothetical protein